MTQRRVDWVLSILAAGLAFALSWPFWRDFEYWGESHVMWWVYFSVGYVMAVYVFRVFLDCVRILFLHDALVKSGFYAKAKPQGDGKEGTP
jgi:hypothetical protein